jgi:P-type E1-E2 ATPase
MWLLVSNLQTTIAIIIVCVPEGLPLVISISMAFSIDNLIRDQLLIKKMKALEISGSVIDIMTGKTCTLTTGDMEVE